jgi:hypothetical protein
MSVKGLGLGQKRAAHARKVACTRDVGEKSARKVEGGRVCGRVQEGDVYVVIPFLLVVADVARVTRSVESGCINK